jgi:hypothetical protein
MRKKDHSKANRLYTESETEVFYLLGRFERLVVPSKGDIHQQVDLSKARFTELQSLALENLYCKLTVEIEQMSDHIADLEMSSGVAKFAGEE